MFCWAGKLQRGTGENKLISAFSWWTVTKLERKWTSREKVDGGSRVEKGVFFPGN